MIDTLLDNNRTYQDMEKNEFIRKLGYVIDDFLQAADTKLIRKTGICDAVKCHSKFKGHTFTGNNSGMHIDLIIEKNENGKVLDILSMLVPFTGKQKTTNYQNRVKFAINKPKTNSFSRIFQNFPDYSGINIETIPKQ